MRNAACPLFATALAILAWAGTSAFAQKPSDPEVGYVFPPGATRGQTATVQLAGYDWTPDLEFFVLDPRVTIASDGTLSRHLMPEPPFPVGMRAYRPFPIPREFTARIDLPADLPAGPVRWQVANANGTSSTGVFYVGEGPEVVENRDGTSPQILAELPVTVSGRISKFEEVDCYVLTPASTGLVTCDLMARRLGAPFHSVLEVRDDADRLVADAVDTQGMDVSVTWSAQAGKRYSVSVRDLNFRGNRACVYRLGLSTGPRILAAIPATVRRGAAQDVEFIGYGLTTGECRLEHMTQTIDSPLDPAQATFSWKGTTPAGTPAEFAIPLSDLPEAVAPPADQNEVTPLEVPFAATGVLDRHRPARQFRLDGKQGDLLRVEAQARRLNSPLDVSLAILGHDGKEIATNDDLPGTTDAALDFTVPEDGSYTVVVSDVSGAQPSPLNVYRLVVQRPEPDFELLVPQHLNVPIGGKVELAVKVTRTGGFQAPIRLEIAGLPSGIEPPADMVIPADQAEFKITLHSPGSAPSGAALVTLTGTAQLGTRTISHRAQALAAGNLAPRDPRELLVETMLVASTMPAVTRIRPIETDERTVHRGTVHLAELAIERLPGFDGEVLVQMDSRQPVKFRQGLVGPDVVVPSGVNRVFYPCLVPQVAETQDAYRLLLEAVVQTPDPAGRMRYLVSRMQADDASVAITVEGALLKISADHAEIVAEPGATLRLPIRIARSAKLTGPVHLEVRPPDARMSDLRAEPFEVTPDQTEVILPVELTNRARTTGKMALTIRALALQSGQPPALSETARVSPMDPELVSLLKSGVLPVVAETTVTLEIAAGRTGGQ